MIVDPVHCNCIPHDTQYKTNIACALNICLLQWYCVYSEGTLHLVARFTV